MRANEALLDFIRQVTKSVPLTMAAHWRNATALVNRRAVDPTEVMSAVATFKFVFHNASAVIERVVGWPGIARWKRQLVLPAVWEWYVGGRRADYLKKKAFLETVRDQWASVETRLKEDVLKPEARESESGPVEPEVGASGS